MEDADGRSYSWTTHVTINIGAVAKKDSTPRKAPINWINLLSALHFSKLKEVGKFERLLCLP